MVIHCCCTQVEYPQATGNVRSDSTSPRQSVHQDAQQGQGGFQQPLGSEPKGAYRTITVGPHHWVSACLSKGHLLDHELVPNSLLKEGCL